MQLSSLWIVGIALLVLGSCSNSQTVVRRLEGLPFGLATFLGQFRSRNGSSFGGDTWRDQLCLVDLEQFGQALHADQRWALEMYDSWGKTPAGLVQGNSFTLGGFEQCRQFTVENSAAVFTGQHCTVRLGVQEGLSLELWLGICVPDSCDATFVKYLVEQFALENNFEAFPGHNQDDFCYRDDPGWKLAGVTIAAIVVLSVSVFIMAACTVVEVLGFILNRPVSKLLKNLSLYHKLFLLFKTVPKTKEKTDTLDCVNGIRSIMMLQILMHHVQKAIRSLPATNHLAREEYFGSSAMGIINYRVSALSADIFLVLSSLLLTYNILKELNAAGKVNVARIWIHRLVRIMPAYAVVIFSMVAFAELVGEAPLYRHLVQPEVEACSKHWWSALLFVQNYVNPDRMCLPHTWYLSVDMQLYLISPLVIYLLWRFGNRFLFGIAFLVLISVACVFTTFMVNDFTLSPPMSPDREFQRDRLTYYPTHARMAVWFCGIAFGYLLFRTREKRVFPPPAVLVGGSIFATALTGVIMFAAYEIYKPRDADPVGDAFFEALHRVAWVGCIMWLIFMCVNGHASALGHFLSWTFWQPVARLSYGIYLIHYVVVLVSFGGMLKQPFYFSEINIQYVTFGVVGLTGALSLVCWLFIEQPFMVLERHVCKWIKNRQ